MEHFKEDHMLWTIAVILIILWMLGLVTGFTVGSFIHLIFVAAVALLVVSLSQEVMINQKLRHTMRGRGRKPDSKRRYERLTDQPISSRIMP
jgi:uncharacterized membrane protein YfcA